MFWQAGPHVVLMNVLTQSPYLQSPMIPHKDQGVPLITEIDKAAHPLRISHLCSRARLSVGYEGSLLCMYSDVESIGCHTLLTLRFAAMKWNTIY